MTLWNPLHVFSVPPRQPGNNASSAFDPSRTGDPPGQSPSMPAIGYGDTRVGTGTGSVDPRRRPIGFAPPEDEPRFRTEFSFKRHYESPRASVERDEESDDGASEWRTPDTPLPVGDADPDETDSITPVADAVAETDVHDRAEAASTPEADVESEERAKAESVPFYKRELSLRRKRTGSDDAGAGEVDGGPDAQQATPAEDPPATTQDAKTEPHVPFYKRELSLRRKAANHEEIPVALVASELDEDEDEHSDAMSMASSDSTSDASIASDEADAGVPTDTVASLEEEAEVEPIEVVAAAEQEPVGPTDSVDPAEQEPVSSTDSVEPVEQEPAATAEHDASPVEDPTEGAKGTSRRGRRSVRSSTRRTSSRGAKGSKVVGLKIGASQLAAAVVIETESGPELVQLARRPLEAGIVVDGEVRDQDALTHALQAFFDEERLPKKGVRIGLGSNRIGVRTFDIVGIEDEARFDNAVRFKAHEVLPVAVHEAVLDYRVLEQRPNEDGEQMRHVLLVVAPQDQVQPYQLVADRVGLKLTGIDLEALGLLRAFVEPSSVAARLVSDTATVVVSIGHESSTLLVAGGGACEFTRVFDWGGAALQSAIAESLQVMPAEASTILRHLSLSGSGRRYESLDDVARAQATEAVRFGLTPFTRELVNSLQFYQTQAESLGIGEIVVTGGTSHLEGLDQALHAMVGVAVSVGDPLSRVTVACDIDPALEAAIGSMAVPIGLAISDGGTRGINLLRESAAAPRSRRSSMIAVGLPIAAAVPLVALGLLYVGASGKVNDQQTQLDAVQSQLAALPVPQGPDIDASVVGDEVVRATSVASVLGGRVAWDAVLRDMSRVLPANVWLTKLSLSQSQSGNLAAEATAPVAAAVPGQTATPTAVTIDGFTYSQPDVARLLVRLGTLSSLRNVTLSSSQAEASGEREVTHFVIVADLTQTGGPS